MPKHRFACCRSGADTIGVRDLAEGDAGADDSIQGIEAGGRDQDRVELPAETRSVDPRQTPQNNKPGAGLSPLVGDLQELEVAVFGTGIDAAGRHHDQVRPPDRLLDPPAIRLEVTE